MVLIIFSIYYVVRNGIYLSFAGKNDLFLKGKDSLPGPGGTAGIL